MIRKLAIITFLSCMVQLYAGEPIIPVKARATEISHLPIEQGRFHLQRTVEEGFCFLAVELTYKVQLEGAKRAMIRNAQLKTGGEEKRNCIATLDQSQLIPLWKDSTSTISHDEESDGKTFKVTYAFLIPKGERGQKLSLFSIGDSDVVYDEGVAKEIASYQKNAHPVKACEITKVTPQDPDAPFVYSNSHMRPGSGRLLKVELKVTVQPEIDYLGLTTDTLTVRDDTNNVLIKPAGLERFNYNTSFRPSKEGWESQELEFYVCLPNTCKTFTVTLYGKDLCKGSLP